MDRLDAATLVSLSQVSRSTVLALEIGLRPEAKREQRQQIREELALRKTAALKQMKMEQDASMQIIESANKELSSNRRKRRQQLAALSDRLSGFDHLQMPAFRPQKRPYWQVQREVVHCVVCAANWQSALIVFSDLAAGTLGKKAHKILQPLAPMMRPGREMNVVLDSCHFDAADAEVLCDFFGGRQALKKLVLNNISCDAEASHMLVSALALSKLEHVSLHDCRFEKVADLLRLILANPELEKLELSETELAGHENAEQLGEVVRCHPKLASLAISGHSKRVEKLPALLDALAGAGKLARLNLSHLEIEDDEESAAAVKKLLATPGGLETLTMSDIHIRKGLAIALGEGMKHDTGLQTLKLNNHDMESKGFISLLDGLWGNKTLRKLTLKGDSKPVLSSWAINALCNFIRLNKTLVCLDITGFHIDDEGKSRLAQEIVSRARPIRLICNAATPWKKFDVSLGREQYIFEQTEHAERNHKQLVRAARDNPKVSIEFV